MPSTNKKRLSYNHIENYLRRGKLYEAFDYIEKFPTNRENAETLLSILDSFDFVPCIYEILLIDYQDILFLQERKELLLKYNDILDKEACNPDLDLGNPFY